MGEIADLYARRSKITTFLPMSVTRAEALAPSMGRLLIRFSNDLQGPFDISLELSKTRLQRCFLWVDNYIYWRNDSSM